VTPYNAQLPSAKDTPTITVLLPVYNGMPYLPTAIESVLAQTESNFRLLVINDGSTDGTAAYLESVSDPRLEVMPGEHCGLGAALNAGIARVQTEYLARMDADDGIAPERFALQKAFLDSHPEVGMVGTRFSYVGNGTRRSLSPRLPLDHATIYADLMKRRLSFIHASLMCRTALMKEIGGYRFGDVGEDWDMFLRMGERTQLANLPQDLYSYRVHLGGEPFRRLSHCMRRIAFAVDCAERRAAGQPELEFGRFCELRDARPWSRRVIETLDQYALGQYRQGMNAVLNDRVLAGYCRLAWSAACSPQRLVSRLIRVVRKERPAAAPQPVTATIPSAAVGRS
jgi:glycosyltransferase involved in cell wall biosynthesis